MSKWVSAGFLLGGSMLVAFLLLYRNTVLDTRPTSTVGAEVYAQACMQCHGPGGKGRQGFIPPLRGRSLPVNLVKFIVRNGRNRMPAQPYIRGEALENLARFVNALK